jgi:hypothetical protein
MVIVALQYFGVFVLLQAMVCLIATWEGAKAMLEDPADAGTKKPVITLAFRAALVVVVVGTKSNLSMGVLHVLVASGVKVVPQVLKSLFPSLACQEIVTEDIAPPFLSLNGVVREVESPTVPSQVVGVGSTSKQLYFTPPPRSGLSDVAAMKPPQLAT